jgi:hypothetical protein
MMNKLVIFAGCLTFLAITTAFAQNFVRSSQSSSIVIQQSDSSGEQSSQSSVVQSDVVQSDTSSDMNRSTIFSSQSSSSDDSYGYQKSSLNLSAANLSQPHFLSINTSGAQMTGQIIVNGKVVQQITNDKNVKIDLSRYLSVGEHKVEVSARYSPSSSSVSVELTGPGTQVSQQNSGNGSLNYTMDVSVR